MDDLGQNKKNNTGMIAAIVAVLAVLAIGAYMYKQKTAVPPAPSDLATTTEAPVTAPVTETPSNETTTAENSVVVPTKELDLGPKIAPTPPVISDPEVKAMMGERSIGAATAPIVVDEYASLTCGHCGAFHRDTFEGFKTEFVDTGKVRMIFHDFPLNPPAIDASMILRCMPEDKFVSFMQLLFVEQDKWAYAENYKDLLKQHAKLAGMNDKQFDDCLANDALKQAIIGDMKYAGDAYKVASTPSFIFNKGQKTLVGSQPLSEFQKTVAEISAAPASKPDDASSSAASPDATTPDVSTDAPSDATLATPPVEATPETVPATETVTPIAE